jgi:hypothetical protein
VVSILVGLATILGLIVFIIPGIYIAVRLAVSIQALVVEGRRGTEASGNDRDPAVRRARRRAALLGSAHPARNDSTWTPSRQICRAARQPDRRRVVPGGWRLVTPIR